jgi:glycosyltransferase involved in cell wall biosynthesis
MKQVDIALATYNGERFIREQIESIQKQSYSNWRLLISDDVQLTLP